MHALLGHTLQGFKFLHRVFLLLAVHDLHEILIVLGTKKILIGNPHDLPQNIAVGMAVRQFFVTFISHKLYVLLQLIHFAGVVRIIIHHGTHLPLVFALFIFDEDTVGIVAVFDLDQVEIIDSVHCVEVGRLEKIEGLIVDHQALREPRSPFAIFFSLNVHVDFDFDATFVRLILVGELEGAQGTRSHLFIGTSRLFDFLGTLSSITTPCEDGRTFARLFSRGRRNATTLLGLSASPAHHRAGTPIREHFPLAVTISRLVVQNLSDIETGR